MTFPALISGYRYPSIFYSTILIPNISFFQDLLTKRLIFSPRPVVLTTSHASLKIRVCLHGVVLVSAGSHIWIILFRRSRRTKHAL